MKNNLGILFFLTFALFLSCGEDKNEVEQVSQHSSEIELVDNSNSGHPKKPKKVEKVKIHEFVEENAEFVGGQAKLYEYLNSNIKYPQQCIDNGIQGKVYVKFAVMKDGSIDDIQVLKKIHPKLDAEAVRVIENMPNWTPGKQKGKAVNVYFTLPINFQIN
jgi:protein TonB